MFWNYFILLNCSISFCLTHFEFILSKDYFCEQIHCGRHEMGGRVAGKFPAYSSGGHSDGGGDLSIIEIYRVFNSFPFLFWWQAAAHTLASTRTSWWPRLLWGLLSLFWYRLHCAIWLAKNTRNDKNITLMPNLDPSNLILALFAA